MPTFGDHTAHGHTHHYQLTSYLVTNVGGCERTSVRSQPAFGLAYRNELKLKTER